MPYSLFHPCLGTPKLIVSVIPNPYTCLICSIYLFICKYVDYYDLLLANKESNAIKSTIPPLSKNTKRDQSY